MFSLRFINADYSDTDRLIDFFRALAGGPDDVPGFGLGELIYNGYRDCDPPLHESVGICTDGQGEIAALCWLEPEHECAFLVHPAWRLSPDAPTLYRTLLEFAVTNLHRITPELSKAIGLTIERKDAHAAQILTSLGLRSDGTIQHHTFRVRSGDVVDEPSLPEGYRFIALTDDSRLVERVDLIKSVWPEHTLDLDRYRNVRSAPIYRSDLELAVETPDGRLAAFATCWLDPATFVGQFEPVGTHPDYRGKGLGKALVQHGTKLLRSNGAERIFINCFAKNDAGNALYRAAGYTLVAEWQWWEYPLNGEKP